MAHIYTATVYEIITTLCRPTSPQQERWRNYFIARGARKLSFVRNSSSGSFVNWQLLPILLWHHTHWKVWAQKQERLNCSVISLLCSGNLWCVIWERPPEGGRKRLASNKTLSAVCRGTSLFIFFFYLVQISLSMYLVHISNCIYRTIYSRDTAEGSIKISGALSNWLLWLLIQISASHVINEGLDSRKNQSQSLVTRLAVITVCVFVCVCWSLRESADIWPQSWPPDPCLTSLSGSDCRAEGLDGSSCWLMVLLSSFG